MKKHWPTDDELEWDVRPEDGPGYSDYDPGAYPCGTHFVAWIIMALAVLCVGLMLASELAK